MANRYMVANGDVWNDFATVLDGGAPLQPADVLRANGFTGTLGVAGDVVTLSELRNDALAPAGSGGSFTLPNRVIVNADAKKCTADQLINYAGNEWAAINGDVDVVFNSTSIGVVGCVNFTGTGNLIVNGKSTGGNLQAAGNNNNRNVGIVVTQGRLDITDVDGGGAGGNGGLRSPHGIWNTLGQVHVTGKACAKTCEAIRGDADTVAIAESSASASAVLGNVQLISDRFIFNKTQLFPVTGTWAFSSLPKMQFINNDDSTFTLAENVDSTLAPNEVKAGVVYDNGSKVGTLEAVNVQQLASHLLNEMNSSNLPLAQGLRDGMGASAAAIAAVGSIQAIP